MIKKNQRFSSLPMEYKQAWVEYMSCETIEDVERIHGERLFTVEIISMEEATKRCMSFPFDAGDFLSFHDYHVWYVGDYSDIPYYRDSVYPVIEGGDNEWLDDGWHRFHSYFHYGHQEVPILRIQD